MEASLWLQTCDRPGQSGARARPARAIVDSKFSFDPKLDGIGIQTQPAPVRRPWNFRSDIFRFGGTRAGVGYSKSPCLLGDRGCQRRARRNGLALMTCPCAHAALPRSGFEIGVVIRCRSGGNLAFDAYLSMAMVPVKNHGGTRIGFQLAALARFEIGVEQDITRLAGDFLAQDHARRRLTLIAHGRQDHGIGIGLRRIGPGLLQPFGGREQRIGG